MNSITAFLVFACIAAGLAAVRWLNPFVAAVFFAAAVLISLSLKMANVGKEIPGTPGAG
jgi:hypothetical protein